MKKLVKEYVFDPSVRQIASPEFFELAISNILLVVNVTTNTVLYNPLNASAGGEMLQLSNGKILSLFLDTTTPGYSSTDELQIWIDDGESPARDDNLDTLVYFASAIHEKLPVCDTNDRVLANVTGSVTLGGGSTTVSTLTTLNTFQNQPVALAPYNWASGAYHIYNGIEVT